MPEILIIVDSRVWSVSLHEGFSAFLAGGANTAVVFLALVARIGVREVYIELYSKLNNADFIRGYQRA